MIRSSKIIPAVLSCIILVLSVKSCDVEEYRNYHKDALVTGEQIFLTKGDIKK
jgi:hypothetical protein